MKGSLNECFVKNPNLFLLLHETLFQYKVFIIALTQNNLRVYFKNVRVKKTMLDLGDVTMILKKHILMLETILTELYQTS